MTNIVFQKGLLRTKKIAQASKFRRFLSNPIRYIKAQIIRHIRYRINKKSIEANVPVFFNTTMHILLPASTDIYLTGGKSHPSELRLTQFMIKHIKPKMCVFDVGAHYGFYALLSKHLVGLDGKVISFEPAQEAFDILTKNCSTKIESIQALVGDTHGSNKNFVEFENKYSEYNSISSDQYQNQAWFNNAAKRTNIINMLSLDGMILDNYCIPDFIKIDVEGSEYAVIQGAVNLLKIHYPVIALEYVQKERDNQSHQQAVNLLLSMGYKSFKITETGDLIQLIDIDAHLDSAGLESDNIIFKNVKDDVN